MRSCRNKQVHGPAAWLAASFNNGGCETAITDRDRHINREGVELGIVRELLSTGPQTVLVLEYQAEGKTQERMIPFVAAYVDTVDVAGKRITVDWQADY